MTIRRCNETRNGYRQRQIRLANIHKKEVYIYMSIMLRNACSAHARITPLPLFFLVVYILLRSGQELFLFWLDICVELVPYGLELVQVGLILQVVPCARRFRSHHLHFLHRVS